MTLANGHYDGGQEYLEVRYNEAVARREVIERDKARGVLVRRLGWPAAMLTLMSLTGKKKFHVCRVRKLICILSENSKCLKVYRFVSSPFIYNGSQK